MSAYALYTDIENQTGLTFTSSTAIKQATIDSWIASESARLDGYLKQAGYLAPASGTNAHEWCKDTVVMIVCWRVEKRRFEGKQSGNKSDRGNELREEYYARIMELTGTDPRTGKSTEAGRVNILTDATPDPSFGALPTNYWTHRGKTKEYQFTDDMEH